ncbi:MAG: M48 family metalloprotease [Limisphaerales bacterium]
MNDELYAKCGCQNCDTHIEFPLDAAGMTVKCPHCNQSTLLSFEAPPLTSSKPTSPMILNAFQSGIRPDRVSFFYQIGLVMVAVMMVILPLIYVALVAAAGWAVYCYAVHCRFLVLSMEGGPRFYLVKLLAYIGPLFIGGVLLFFMVKPLFARRPKRAQPLALDPGANSTLFAFVAKICDAVAAPMPKRIYLDCQLNASAGFRRGPASLLGNDLVLTIGLPLVAGLNMQQFAGVIAHEFGHFTQGFGMRLSYVIRSVNNWFARVVYERDAWDEWLTSWAEETEDWRSMIVVNFARLAVWISRLLLKLLMYLGHGVSCFLLRQMEYHADSYEIKLAGSAAFEQTLKRFNVLGDASGQSYKAMRVMWNIRHILPDDFPAYLIQHESMLPPEHRAHIEDTVGLSRTKIFDTHPSAGDRIRCARQAGEPGVFHLDHPAALLFANFEAVSKQVTFLHYSDDLGLVFDQAALQPVSTSTSTA